jgi:hypothetical protein
MKTLIKKKLRHALLENTGMETLCYKMSVATYHEGIRLITAAIGPQEQNPSAWQSIAEPLSMWQKENSSIGQEVRTQHMSGDSMVDESNTWWAAIQGTLCK